jgi:hypothetical protein
LNAKPGQPAEFNALAFASTLISPLEKILFSTATLHQNECYHPVLNVDGGNGLLFMRVQGTRESLIFQPNFRAPETVLARDTYVLDPCFAGDRIFWVEKQGALWPIRTAELKSLDKITSPIPTTGRPQRLTSGTAGDKSVLAWEERDGKKTKVRFVLIEGGKIGEPVDVTDGQHNGYDPVCCFDKDGNLFLAYTSFEGQYVVRAQQFSKLGVKVGSPVMLSASDYSCIFPSIYPAQDGGVWFSYTSYDSDDTGLEKFGGHSSPPVMLNEPRYAAQTTFFHSRGRAYAGLLKDGAISVPVDAKNGGLLAESSGCAHTQIVENSKGRVYLLLRQHAQKQPVDFAKIENPLPLAVKKPGMEKKPGKDTTSQEYTNLSVCLLGDQGWTTPVCLIQNARFDQAISHSLNADTLTSAFMEDGRRTGFMQAGERHDTHGQVGVGRLRVQLNAQPVSAAIPMVQREVKTSVKSIQNPIISNPKVEGFIHAIGQTHCHTEFSVCCREYDRDIQNKYRFFQDVQNQDFVAITDHSYNLWQTEILILQKMAEYHYFPGKFVGLRAYEFTADPHGHVNPILFEDDRDLSVLDSRDKGAPGDYTPLWNEYQGMKLIAPPHHPADAGHTYDWSMYKPDFQPVVEVFQDHRGSGEQPDAPGVSKRPHHNAWIVPALLSGDRFGLMASGDHMGISCAGVLTRELTREALYEAFKARRAFGTSGFAMKLLLSCNGQPMGSSLNTETGNFRLTAEAGDPIKEIQVLRDGKVESVIPVGAAIADKTWTGQRKRAGEFWFCRVMMENGHIAWTSPIWLG